MVYMLLSYYLCMLVFPKKKKLKPGLAFLSYEGFLSCKNKADVLNNLFN